MYCLPESHRIVNDANDQWATEILLYCFLVGFHSFAIELNFKLVIVTDAILHTMHTRPGHGNIEMNTSRDQDDGAETPATHTECAKLNKMI